MVLDLYGLLETHLLSSSFFEALAFPLRLSNAGSLLMNKQWQIPRRTFLRGLGTAMALPVLEAMVPSASLAAAITTPSGPPRRMAFIFVPNGVNMADWTPKTVGSDFELPAILEPLKFVQKELLVLSGLAHDKGRPNGDGA